jgi:hypothetical protein
MEHREVKTAGNKMDTLSAILRKAKQWGYVCEGVDLDAWSNDGSMTP